MSHERFSGNSSDDTEGAVLHGADQYNETYETQEQKLYRMFEMQNREFLSNMTPKGKKDLFAQWKKNLEDQDLKKAA